MNLQAALDQVELLNDDLVIFAKRPWRLDSDAEIGSLDENLKVPMDISSRDLHYFLEVSVAKEVLEVLGDRDSTEEQRRSLLLFYAENDAYPQWVYET